MHGGGAAMLKGSWFQMDLANHVNNNSYTLDFLAVAADVNLVWPQVPVMVQLIIVVGSDEERSDSLVASAAGLLG